MKITRFFSFFLFGCILSGAASCVQQNPEFGYSFIPDNERFVTCHVQIPLDKIYVSMSDSLSAYNTQRFTIGAIDSPTFGLNRHTSAFTIIPMNTEMEWGKNIRNIRMRMTATKDTISVSDPSQASIIQNVRVYSLQERDIVLDSKMMYSNQLTKAMFDGCTSISKGVPTYDGGKYLEIEFTEAFARQYLKDENGDSWEGRTQTVEDAAKYSKTLPGIFICTDDPGRGQRSGRINMFTSRTEIDSNGGISGTFIEYDFTAEYGDRTVDTVFFFSVGATSVYSAKEAIEYKAFNCCEHESFTLAEDGRFGAKEIFNKKAYYLTGDKIQIEGGCGLKPVIRAVDIRNAVAKAVKDTLAKYGLDDVETAFLQKQIFINKASIKLPFEAPSGIKGYEFLPKYLNPTLRVSAKTDENEKVVAYGGITDARVSDENQGDINYSTSCYKPDIANHLQEILATDPTDAESGMKKLQREDLWFFILADETITTTTVSSGSDYDYSQLAYLNYYNNMLAGGYGYGYGSYGYGYDSYSNYYNYMMMQSLMSSASEGNSSSIVTTTLDVDRYYDASLTGHSDVAASIHPKLELVYSFLRHDSLN